MNMNAAKPAKVAIIGASGTYGKGVLARAEEVGIKVVVVTRSAYKFKDVKQTTKVLDTQLYEEEKLKEAFTNCDGVISALGDDRKKRTRMHNLPHVWNVMKATGVTKYVGMASGAMMPVVRVSSPSVAAGDAWTLVSRYGPSRDLLQKRIPGLHFWNTISGFRC